jgi:hypothetical protein
MRMQKCELNLGRIGFKSEIDNTENLRCIARRLPYRMRERWMEKSLDIMEREGRPASFTDLSAFIQGESETSPLEEIYATRRDEEVHVIRNHLNRVKLRQPRRRRLWVKENRGSHLTSAKEVVLLVDQRNATIWLVAKDLRPWNTVSEGMLSFVAVLASIVLTQVTECASARSQLNVQFPSARERNQSTTLRCMNGSKKVTRKV